MSEPTPNSVAPSQADLDRITLCCVDTNTGGLGYLALLRSLKQFPVSDAILVSAQRPRNLDHRVRWIAQSPFASVDEYSHFVLTSLRSHIATTHCLIVQWDGFVRDAACWNSAFLDYDYIGAPWPQFADELAVGNGGFSLRSKRLLDALADPAMVLHAPEDLCICHTNRAALEARHAIRFAPLDIAAGFAFERGPPRPTFGFHGLFNFPMIGDEVVRNMLAMLPGRLLSNRDAHDLAGVLAEQPCPGQWRLQLRIWWATARYRPTQIHRLFRIWLNASAKRRKRARSLR